MSTYKVALLLSYICIASISAALITPALPHIQTFYALSNSTVAWVVSIFLVGYVLGQLVYGPLANRFGRLTALRIGLVINLIGIFLCMASIHYHTFHLLLFGRFITALGASSGLACTFMLLNELLSAEQARQAMSYTIVSFTAGIGLAVILGGVITEYLHWEDCFLLLLIHGVIMLICTRCFKETLKVPKAIHPRAIIHQYVVAFRSKQLVIYALLVGFVSVFSYGYAAAAPLYTQKIIGLSAAEYGYWNILNMVGMCASGFLSSYFVKKYGEKKVLFYSLVLILPGLIALLFIAFMQINNSIYFFINTCYLYLMTGLLFPSASYFASNAIEDKASASSAMSFINMGSAVISVMLLSLMTMPILKAFVLVLTVFYCILIGLKYLSGISS